MGGANEEVVLRVTRLLYAEADLEPEPPWHLESIQQFVLWQQSADPLHYQRPLETRFEMAMILSRQVSRDGVELFKTVLTRGLIPPLAYQKC